MTTILQRKTTMILLARAKWPRYATVKEDMCLKSSKWYGRYDNKRPVFHDNTGIDIAQPTDSFHQRITYSSYYGGNVAKGGVFIQLCGWLGTYDLYPGAISDSDYLKNAGVFESQKDYQEKDGGIPFLNIVDRGYRITKAAWMAGQFVLQPIFSKSDRKFNTLETLKSSSIAADRSGNERSVRLCNNANIFRNSSKKCRTTSDIERVCDFWLTYSFQVNFMYKNCM